MIQKVIFSLLLALCFTLISCDNVTDNPENSVSSNSRTIVSPSPFPEETIISSHGYPTAIPTIAWTPQLIELKNSLLGDPCAAPCWFGIEPGKTTQDQLTSTLNQWQKEGFIQEFYLTNSFAYVIVFVDSFGATVAIEESTGIVESFQIVPESFGKFLTLGDIIDHYGDPMLVRPAPGQSHEGIRIIYPDQQIEVWLQNESLGGNQMITADLIVRSYGYDTPELIDLSLSSPGWVNWDGYESFLYYYQMSNSET
jgi:hypothetical protein